MIKGTKKKEVIDMDTQFIDDLLQRTTGGYDIFRYYLGTVGRIMKRPWGKDNNPSWGIFPRGTVWFYKDQATEETGNAIHFVQKYFGLTFPETVHKIRWDFGFGGTVKNLNPAKVTWEKPDIERDYLHIGVITKPFEKRHHEFWNAAEVDEAHCNKYNCFAVKNLSINRKRAYIGRDEIVFAYHCPVENGYKIYFPDREKGNRFRNNVSGHYLWNYENVGKCQNLVIQKSMKDLIVTTMITPCVIATQNESAGIFDDDMVGKINSLGQDIFIAYGSDDDGKNKSIKISRKNGWKWVNPPNKMLPEVNDFYGMACKYGLKSVEELLKSKHII